jgi:hypothetical protein
LGERGGRDGADDVGVAFGLASDQHAVTMARRRAGMQPDFVVTAEKRRREADFQAKSGAFREARDC